MKTNLKKVEFVSSSIIVPYCNLSELNKLLQNNSIQNYLTYNSDLNDNKIFAIKKNNFYITREIFKFYSKVSKSSVLELEVIEFDALFNYLKEKHKNFSFIRNEFYTNCLIATYLHEEFNFDIELISIFLEVSLTTAYKIRYLLNIDEQILLYLQYNLMPVDFSIELARKYNVEIIMKAIQIVQETARSPFELFTVCNDLVNSED